MLKKAVVKIQSDDFMTLRGSQRIDDSETEIKNQSRPNSGSSSSSSTSSTGKLAIEWMIVMELEHSEILFEICRLLLKNLQKNYIGLT